MSILTTAAMGGRRPRQQYLGKYRGVVLNNADPQGIGRLQVQVIGVFTVASSWALPCFPVAGTQTGMVAVPPVGAGVWVEFERGHPDHPIWTGCYFSTRSEVPPMAQQVTPPIPVVTVQTPLKNGMRISDAPPTKESGGIELRSAAGASIVVNDSGIHISDGKGGEITLIGGKVSVNSGALVVQ